MDDTRLNGKQKKTTRKIEKSKMVAVALAVVLVLTNGIGIWLYRGQAHRLADSSEKAQRLKTSVDKLNDEKKSLTDKNMSLSEVVKAYAKEESVKAKSPAASTQSTAVSVNTTGSGVVASAKTILDVTSVRDLTAAYFGSTNAQANAETIRIVFFTIKNNTQTDQTYMIHQFGAVTDSGEILKSRLYGGADTGNPWYIAKITPGGSAEGYASFETGKNIVALAWNSDNGATAIDSTLPAVQ